MYTPAARLFNWTPGPGAPRSARRRAAGPGKAFSSLTKAEFSAYTALVSKRRTSRAGAARRATGPLYELSAVGRATGAAPSLLKSWCEQGILVPAIEARGTGTRRYFDRATVLRAAILGELRHLLGTRLRLGEIGKWVATLDPDLIDRQRDPARVYLFASRVGDSLSEAYVSVSEEDPVKFMHTLRQWRAAVVLDLTAINERVWTALEE